MISSLNINAKSFNENSILPSPTLKEGKAIIIGKIDGYKPTFKSIIRVSYHNHIINENDRSEVEISPEGQMKYFMNQYQIDDATPSFVIIDKEGKPILMRQGLSDSNMKDIISLLDKSI